MHICITGDKIRLENTRMTDIEAIIEFEVANSGWIHHYPKEKHVALLTDEDCLHLSVKRLDNDRLAGHVIAFGVTSPDRVFEFRRIAINEKGSGFGRETVGLLKRICFEELGFHRMWLDVYDDNERAIRLYESEGFVYEGTLRENRKTADRYRSQRIYSMLETEYRAKSQRDRTGTIRPSASPVP